MKKLLFKTKMFGLILLGSTVTTAAFATIVPLDDDGLQGIIEPAQERVNSVFSQVLGDVQSTIDDVLPEDLANILGSRLDSLVGKLGIIDLRRLEELLDEEDETNQTASQEGYTELEWKREKKKDEIERVAQSVTSSEGQEVLEQRLKASGESVQKSDSQSQNSLNASRSVRELSNNSTAAKNAIEAACNPAGMKITQDLLKCSINQQKEQGKQNAYLAAQNAEIAQQFAANSSQLKELNSQLASVNSSLVEEQTIQALQLTTSQQILEALDGQNESNKNENTRSSFWAFDTLLKANIWMQGRDLSDK